MKYVQDEEQIRFIIITSDTKFQIALINFLNDYPVEPNSTTLQVGKLKDETGHPKTRLPLVDNGR